MPCGNVAVPSRCPYRQRFDRLGCPYSRIDSGHRVGESAVNQGIRNPMTCLKRPDLQELSLCVYGMRTGLRGRTEIVEMVDMNGPERPKTSSRRAGLEGSRRAGLEGRSYSRNNTCLALWEGPTSHGPSPSARVRRLHPVSSVPQTRMSKRLLGVPCRHRGWLFGSREAIPSWQTPRLQNRVEHCRVDDQVSLAVRKWPTAQCSSQDESIERSGANRPALRSHGSRPVRSSCAPTSPGRTRLSLGVLRPVVFNCPLRSNDANLPSPVRLVLAHHG